MTAAVLLTGTVGAGKTVVAAEIGWQLSQREIPVAVIDLDWMGWVHLGPDEKPERIDELIAANLAATRPNYLAAGIGRFVLARALLRRSTIEGVRAALAGMEVKVILLTASRPTLEARLHSRDTGRELEEHLGELGPFTERAEAVEADAVIVNEGRPVSEVAAEVLRLAGW
jgi:broad-specificity NMP kinase